jgi:tetratricopeptide (TPR) repeat protein/predicted Ser/Thr protein kinase
LDLVGSNINRIRIAGVIGQGGMGRVYDGYDEKLGRRIAVKAIQAEAFFDAAARARLIREARALAKIEHPNLCRVFDVIEHEGADFLALEYIEGKTLRQAVAAGLTFQEKIRIAASIADVLAAAHRAGILHRDLKPENVMITHAGEVKVLDFGLARFFESVDDDDPGATSGKWAAVPAGAMDDTATMVHPRNLAVDSHTAAGTVVGTPLYMSPEQARGQRLTPASDLYSFGLLLQFLLDGRDAYDRSAGGAAVMRMAAAGTSAPLATRDSDLRALVNALKSFTPSERPTAVRAHRRLQRIGTRRARRLRAAAIATVLLLLAAGALKYMFDLRSERAAALAARQEADLRRAAADELMAFMIGDLNNRLQQVGKLEVLDAVSEKALSYFASVPPDETSQTDLRRNADVLLQLGELRMTRGEMDQARIAFHRALGLARRATSIDPRDADSLFILGRAHSWLGIIHYREGDTAAGIAQMTRYLEAAGRLSAILPKADERRGEVALAHVNLGSFAERSGEIDTAIGHYETALGVTAEMSRIRPSDTDLLRSLALSTNKIAVALFRGGRLRDAQTRYAEERRLLGSLLAMDPKDERVLQRVAINHDHVGSVDLTQGKIDEAIAEFEADIALQKHAVDRDPANLTWRRNLAAAHRQMGDAVRARDPVRAAEIYAGAAAIMNDVLAKQRKEIDPVIEMAFIETGWARALQRRNRAAAARPHVENAIALIGSLKPSAATKRPLALALITQGEIDAAAGRTAAARERWTEAERALSPRAPNLREPRILDLWARVHLHLDRPREAQPILDALDAMGYRNYDLEELTTRAPASTDRRLSHGR